MAETVAAILAGGEGRRMGGGKPLQKLGGIRLIDIAVARALRWEIEVAVCVRSAGQVPGLEVPQILDANYEGPIGGIIAALRWAREMGAVSLLSLPCDTPALPADLLARLQAAASAQTAPCFARSQSGDHPTCALWPVAMTEPVEAFADAGGRSLKAALALCGAHAVSWRCEDCDPFFNVNTREDLHKFERHAP